MTAQQSRIEPALRLQFVAASDVDTFVLTRNKEAAEKAEAQSALAKARDEARREIARVEKATADYERRLEAQAEEIATRCAQKLKAKQEAILAATALTQASVIAQDYADLEVWMTDTIMAAVAAILKDVQPTERWAGLIRSCLSRTGQRWKLDLLCHPEDADTINKILTNEPPMDAISRLVRDASVPSGVCYIKSDNELYELNLSAQLDALTAQIAASLSKVDRERKQPNTGEAA